MNETTGRHTRVVVDRIPPCDICGETAYADAKTNRGPWANLCATHFYEFKCSLGLGRGQRFVLRGAEVARETRDEHEFQQGWDHDPSLEGQ